MLVLSRKKDEVIVIGDNVRVRIVDVRTDSVKIGIDAPAHIKVYREELWKEIQLENKSAAIQSGKDQPPRISDIVSEHFPHSTNNIDGLSSSSEDTE